VGNEPFAVLYGDDVVMGENPATKQLISAYDEFGLGVAGIKPVSEEAILKYSSLKVDNIRNNIFRISDMIEKPSRDKILSLYSILGRVVLPPEIFTILENTPAGAGGEIQLTDAMKTLTLTKGMTGVEYEGTRYDMGNKMGVMQAIVETALLHPEIKDEFKEYILSIAKLL
jgi:UTP--glucose-1-phosphate uridylyltransferase